MGDHPNRALKELRGRLLPALTTVQHATSPFIGIFLLVHLSAPVAAIFGGSNLASQVMLLGREYYQTTLTEPLLVWLPLGLHFGASFIKRAILGRPKKSTILGSTAWPLAIFLLPTHILIHRYYPSIPTTPIASLGPSQLDYEYVKIGLFEWPRLSWAIYGGLIMCTVVHALEGIRIVWRLRRPATKIPTYQTESILPSRHRRIHPMVLVGLTAVGSIGSVVMGLAVLASEPVLASRALTFRVHATYIQSLLFRLTAQ